MSAEALLNNGDLQGALAKAEEKLDEGKRTGDKNLQADMLRVKANIYCLRQEGIEAMRLIEEVRKIKGSDLDSKALEVLASAHLLQNSPTEAKKAAKQMLSQAQQEGNKGMQGNAWLTMANVHTKLEDEEEQTDRSTPADAMEAAQKALGLYLEAKDKKGEATALMCIAKAHLRMEKVQDGLGSVEESLGLWRELGQTRGMVSALEVMMQAHCMQGNPTAGLQAANDELKTLRAADNKRGMLDVVEMLAQTHAMLGEPIGALGYANEARKLAEGLGDKWSEAWMLHTIADMERARGHVIEATTMAELSVKKFRACGSKEGEDVALQTMSLLYMSRGLPEKAPKRTDVAKAVKELVMAVKMRKTEDLQKAEAKLNVMGDLLLSNDVNDALAPALQQDPTLVEYLEEQGWHFDKSSGDGKGMRLKLYPNRAFYLNSIIGGMNFGPQFRVNHPGRWPANMKDLPESDTPVALSVGALPETEAWQMEMGFRPGMLDCGLQCQGVFGFA